MRYEYTPEHLALAAEFAAKYHGGQVDKTGDPYLFHLHRVSAEAYREYGMLHAIVGMLHDVVEDTIATGTEVGDVFGTEVLFAVIALTRADGETYGEYINRVATHQVASQVKRIDLADNLNRNPRLLYADDGAHEAEARSLAARYVKAFDTLDDAAIKGSYR